MQKVDGVESAKVSLKDGVTTLELKAGNAVTVARLREIIKNNGYVSKEVAILAHGAPMGANAFKVSGTGEQLIVTGRPVAEPGAQWRMTSPSPAK